MSSKTSTRETTLQQNNVADADEDVDASESLEHLNGSTDEVVVTLKSIPLLMDEMKEDGSTLPSPHKSHKRLFRSSSAMLLVCSTVMKK